MCVCVCALSSHRNICCVDCACAGAQVRGATPTGLKLTDASNTDVDAIFEAITGSGGGAAVATTRELLPRLWPMAVQAGTTDPRIAALRAEAQRCRDEAVAVHVVLEAVLSTEGAEREIRSLSGEDAPVVAQLGAIVLKRNMKLGEIVSKCTCAIKRAQGLHTSNSIRSWCSGGRAPRLLDHLHCEA